MKKKNKCINLYIIFKYIIFKVNIYFRFSIYIYIFWKGTPKCRKISFGGQTEMKTEVKLMTMLHINSEKWQKYPFVII